MVGFFQISEQNTADNTLMLQLLQNSVYTASEVSVSLSAPTVNRLLDAQEVGRGHNQTDDQN